MSSSAAASFVLKIVFGDDVHRVPIKGAVNFTSVQEALRGVAGGLGEVWAEYEDDEGDLCGLVEASFQDFLSTARPSGGRRLLRVRLCPPTAVPRELADDDAHVQEPERYQMDAQDSPCASPRDSDSGSDIDEEDAAAMAEQARSACQEVLVDHLRQWLSSEPSTVRFEAWIREVHPENCKCGAVDPRMYCEAGDHRRIWNAVAAEAPGLTEEERASRFVAARHCAPTQVPPAGLCGEASGQAPPPAAAATSTSPRLSGEQGGKHDDAHAESLKKKAAHHVASNLPAFADDLRRRARKTDRAQQALPLELRPGFELLLEVLQLSGPALEMVAEAAEDVVTEDVFFGTGVALLATRAAALPWDGRVLVARLLCENCPQLLSSCRLPAGLLASCCAASRGSASAEAWVAKEAAKAAYREQRSAARVAYEEAKEKAKAVRRKNTERHSDAMRQLAESHAQDCRRGTEARKAACKAHADTQQAATTARQQAQRSLFAWWL